MQSQVSTFEIAVTAGRLPERPTEAVSETVRLSDRLLTWGAYTAVVVVVVLQTIGHLAD